MRDQFWSPTDADLELGEPLLWAHTIHIRADSLTEPPDMKRLTPLDQDPYRLAYWMAVVDLCQMSDSRSKQVLKLLKEAKHSMKVTFLHCTSDEHAEKRKWRLANNEQTAAVNATLRGWKRVVGVQQVAAQLKAWSQQNSAEAVSAWLQGEKVAISPKVIRQMGVVHARIVAADLEPLLEAFEDRFGVDHLFSKLSNLDAACSGTRVDKNPGLQSALLKWVMEDIFRGMVSKVIPSEINRDAVASQVKSSLLARRIVVYLSTKLKIPAPPDQQPNSTSPTPPFQSQQTVWLNFLSHKRFDDSRLGCPSSDHTWCMELLPFQREALSFFKQLLMPCALVRDVLQKSIDKEAFISAEEALQLPHWMDLMCLSKLLEARDSDLIQAGLMQPPSTVPAQVELAVASEEVAATTIHDHLDELIEVEFLVGLLVG
jgi:hypothetical protein